MTTSKAYEILEINSEEEVTSSIIKKHYRLAALKYHPDKNKDVDAVAKFQKISEAYEFLCKSNNMDEETRNTDYETLLFSFLKKIIGNRIDNDVFYVIIRKIINICNDKSIEWLNRVNKDILIQIYKIFHNYKEVFHFSIEFMDKIKEIIKSKKEDETRIVLHPLLDDLFENNLYKLSYNNKIYIIPLWHHELTYEKSEGKELIVECYPILPDNMRIDEDNNIHVKIEYTKEGIWEHEELEITLGSRTFKINRNILKMVKSQKYILYSRGISQIYTDDIYNIANRGDIHIYINIV
jgi:hypothetical protein